MTNEEKQEQLREFFESQKIPVLPLDSRWHQIYSEHSKSTTIQSLESDLNSLLKQQGNTFHELKDLKKLKKHILTEIVNNMEETSAEFESLRLKKLSKSGKIIEDINKKINKLEEDNEQLPDSINKANEELAIASVMDCYELLNQNEQELQEITDWIEKTRIELKNKIIIKQEKEEMNTRVYSYMHDLLGNICMEFFDKQNDSE